MKSIHLLIVIVACATLFCSCESLIEKFFGKNEELSFTRTDYVGDELRTNGYYYCRHEGYGSVSYDIIFFYRNGVIFSAYFSTSNGELSEVEDNFGSKQFARNIKKSAIFWGLFIIDSTSIQYEELDFGPFRAFINSGEILNDTTFVITKRKSSYDSYGLEESTLQDTFLLKQFSPKLDSTNVYIK